MDLYARCRPRHGLAGLTENALAMSENTAVLKFPATRDGAKPEEPVPSRTFAWAAGLMFLGTITLTWIYLQGNHSLSAAPSGGWLAAQAQTELVGRFNRILWRALWVSAVSGIAGLGFLSFGLVRWRRAWKSSLESFREQSLQWRVKALGFERQLSETRDLIETTSKSESKARSELTELTQKHAELRAELDKRKRSEKTLSAQRQSLESSKTVLEVHVQARTVELQKMQRRYELILNSAGEGICGFDLDGKTTFVNPAVARMTGRKIEELLGRTADELFRPQNAEDKDSGEQIFHRQDQTPFVVEFVRTRIEEEGRHTGSVLIFKDITERKRSEETLSQKAAELTRSNAELEQFAFVASHDLQEPLRKIQAFGDRLKMKCETTMAADARDYLDRMQKASARMRTLIDDLLAFSRVIRSGEPFAQVDLAHIAREVVGDLELRLEKTGGRVELGELPTIEADATQMRQLLLNLIGNALKFQTPGTQPLVKVSGRNLTSGSGELFWEIKVEDNGIGFEEQYAEKIFAVFQRLHGRDEFEGTGIGLAVCRRITDRHGGHIVAKSQPGKGATFIITLPARQSH